MYKLVNGWTKKKVMEQIKKYNNGTKSYDPLTDSCLYKSEDGNRCAVGCFLPSRNKAMSEGWTLGAHDLLEEMPHLKKLMPFEGKALSHFQGIHDMANVTHDGDVYRAMRDFLKNKVC